jgi:hypothetical protein
MALHLLLHLLLHLKIKSKYIVAWKLQRRSGARQGQRAMLDIK